MCGILFKTNYHTKTDQTKFSEALELLNHRGPDETGILYTDDYSFGHKRLAIRDIKNGKQPMSILNQHLIYNGEIYNCEELTEMLLDLGIRIDFSSDTLVLLKALMTFKTEILNHINGIFAFVYTSDDEVLAVRDMFGVKPLYYTIYQDDLIVASEIKSLVKYTEEAIINKDGIAELLGMGPSHSLGKTIFKGIYELRPGHLLKFSKAKGLVIERYYQLKARSYNYNYKETVKKVNELVTKAIKRQMISDVGLSTFLSGGLDSSIISTIVAKNVEKLDTYSIDYENNKEDYQANAFETSRDADFTGLVSKAISSNQHDVLINNQTVVDYLTKTVDLRDTPGMTDIDSSMYFLATNIAKDHKVALSGECADEIFAGYPWFYSMEKEIIGFPWIRNLDYREELLNAKWKEKIKLHDYVLKEYHKAISEAPIDVDDTENAIKHRRLCYINMHYFMTNLLDRKDRMTMGTSLEVRVPFCDKDLVEFLYNVPYKYKYRSKTEKKLLRDSFEGIVIPEVINRKKSPYPKSNSHVYSAMVKELLLNVLLDKNSVLYELFDVTKIYKLINDEELAVPWYGQLMRKTSLMAYLYQIDYWYKKYNVRIEE